MKAVCITGMILLILTLGWGTSSVGQEHPTPRGELRIVDKHPQNYISIVYNVFEHLIEFDSEGTLVPRLATSWRWRDDRTLEFTLRQGVTFHNGEVFDAEIVKLNWEENTRLKQPLRHLLREAGYANGLPLTLIASDNLAVQATVVSKMLEQVGFQAELQILDAAAYNRQTFLSYLEQPSEHQAWDIALAMNGDTANFPVFSRYHHFALDGRNDWVVERPELRELYEQALSMVDRERQQALLRQMERHTRDQAYFLLLYNPIALYAVNQAVEFVPYVNGVLNLAETGVTEQHWSVRQAARKE